LNLGTLMAWEQIYLFEVKGNSPFATKEEVIEYLTNEKQFDDSYVKFGYQLYDFAEKTFSKKEWEQVDTLFTTLDQGRWTNNFDSMMGSIGEVLWEMGNLFGTNAYKNVH
jgi:hypothetical protein